MCKGPVIVYRGVRGEGRGAGKFWGDYMVFRGDRRRISSRQQSEGRGLQKVDRQFTASGGRGGGGVVEILQSLFPPVPVNIQQ